MPRLREVEDYNDIPVHPGAVRDTATAFRLKFHFECAFQKRCECRVCERSRRIMTVAAKLQKESAAVMMGLLNDLCEAETDAEYWEMKAKGTWPRDAE